MYAYNILLRYRQVNPLTAGMVSKKDETAYKAQEKQQAGKAWATADL